jgi:gephyrin
VDVRLDTSGPTIRNIIQSAGCTCQAADLLVVPDEIAKIRAAVQTWIARGDIDWIITTGGTGFGGRDQTPEVRPHQLRAV